MQLMSIMTFTMRKVLISNSTVVSIKAERTLNKIPNVGTHIYQHNQVYQMKPSGEEGNIR